MQNSVSDNLNKGLGQIKRIFTNEDDIISVIETDHKPLKELIEVMKGEENSFIERKQAFTEFVPLLVHHAKAEEKSLYDFMKTQPNLREQAYHNLTEHEIADQLVKDIKGGTREEEVSAKIKVLAEAVGNHIQEEETHVLPDVRSKVDQEKLNALKGVYISFQDKVIGSNSFF